MAGTIVDYGTLKTATADYINRKDVNARIPDFIQIVHIEIQEIVGPLAPLNADTDTNFYLDYNPYTYLWGACREAAAYMKDADMQNYYSGKYDEAKQRLSMADGFDTVKMRPNTRVV